jgi:predicted O-linked N-acetylglucosamine transferase (SPINDLY family)
MATISQALATATEHHQAGRLQAAEQIYRQILAVEPGQADAWHLLGVLAYQVGKHEIAVQYIGRAIGLNRSAAEFHNDMGKACRALRKIPEAVACYRQALELKPEFAEAQNNLGNALKEQGKLDEAVACYRRALQLQPDYAKANSNLGVALKDRGELDEAVACCRRALELRPDLTEAHDNLLLALQYRAGVTLRDLAEAHAEYDRRHAGPLRSVWPWHERAGDGGRRLRVGFVSADFGQHPVGYFLIRPLENLDRSQWETVCYSDRIIQDSLTTRFQAAATTWRNVSGLSDKALADAIFADRIDILFDLAGHTARNRLLVFARKPAPIQVTWIGYEGTTGLSAMDYLLADRHVVPEGSQRYYREKVLRMPQGYLCYDPPAAAPPVGPLPSLTEGSMTFGSFNNPAKITAEVVAVWAKILRRAPTARLLLKYWGLDEPTVKGRYLDLFAAHGVGPQRLELLPSSSHTEYLAAYHRVDVALDPFPFSGGVTTCEALWMGIPVITCPGETFASRHSLSHLSNAGLTETIAGDLEEYVEIAVSLAGDPPRLAALRAGLRQRMAASPLCDGKCFAANLAIVLRDVWRQSIVQGEG